MSVVSTLTPSLGGSKPKMYRACREPCFLLPPSLSKCHACAYRSMYANAKRSFPDDLRTAAHIRNSVSQPCFFVRLFRQLIFVSSCRTRTAAYYRLLTTGCFTNGCFTNVCFWLLLASAFRCGCLASLLRLAALRRSRHVRQRDIGVIAASLRF